MASLLTAIPRNRPEEGIWYCPTCGKRCEWEEQDGCMRCYYDTNPRPVCECGDIHCGRINNCGYVLIDGVLIRKASHSQRN